MSDGDAKRWYVMRDLKRPNSKMPAYKQIEDLGVECFTPMEWVLITRLAKHIREKVPIIHDLLFIHDTKQHLDIVLQQIPTLQYRFQKGKGYQEPMIVPDHDMERFIQAVSTSENPQYYLPEELNSTFKGCQIRIIGGSMDGFQGQLLTVKGSKKKRILVELPGWLTVAVEVSPEFIELIK